MCFLVNFTFSLCAFFVCFGFVLLEHSDINNDKNIRHPLEIRIEIPEIDHSVHDRQKRQLLFPIATLLQVCIIFVLITWKLFGL